MSKVFDFLSRLTGQFHWGQTLQSHICILLGFLLSLIFYVQPIHDGQYRIDVRIVEFVLLVNFV